MSNSETSARANPFSKTSVLAMLAFGTIAFLALLYAIGSGWDGRQDRNGDAHAASNGLTGYSAFASLLEARGFEISLSRNEAMMSEEALLILTPPQFGDPEPLIRHIDERRYIGPTLVILPKWYASLLPDNDEIEAEDGWVALGGVSAPSWFNDLDYMENSALRHGETAGWEGLGLSGDLAEPERTQVASRFRAEARDEDEEGDEAGEIFENIIANSADATPVPAGPMEGLIAGNNDNGLIPMVRDAEGDILAGFRDDNGYYPFLSDMAGKAFSNDEVETQNEGTWPVIYVFEPDLVNNYGMADLERARLAERIILASMDDYDLPIIFDLTLNGLGQSQNLLTLAFEPPFLAATLCMLFAALVIAWRSFVRFGPPLAPLPGFIKGKTALARNGAYLVERAKRLHLLGPPFADMISRRMAKTLSIHSSDMAERDAAIDEALTKQGYLGPSFSSSANMLRDAGKPQELLRGARALRTIERTLDQ